MKLDALLDVEVVAVETADHLSALVQLTAPSATDTVRTRTPSTLVVVLDRSGSMGGERLEGAKKALLTLVDQLAPTDRFGLVTFDDAVRVDVPAGPLTDKHAVKRRIAHVREGGMTDLSSGYLRGLQEARRAAGSEGATVLLISDGHANAGITDADQLASIASTFAGKSVSTSALGYGLGYDERLLSAVAKGGRGNELFAEDPDRAGALIAGEVDGLLSQTIQAASLLVRMSPAVKQVALANDMVASPVPDGLMVELGGFWADEERKLLLTFDVPGLSSLGLARVATLELPYVDVATMMEQTVSLPLHVNVVPGDEAAGRITNPFVKTEMAFLAAQASKRRASRRLSDGDAIGAVSHLREASASLTDALAGAPPGARRARGRGGSDRPAADRGRARRHEPVGEVALVGLLDQVAAARPPTGQPVSTLVGEASDIHVGKETAIGAQTQPHLEVADADFVTPRLLVGGDLAYDDDQAAAQLAELVAVGVTHVIDVRIEYNDEDFVRSLAPELVYLHHGVDDAGQRIPAAWFDVGVGFALAAWDGDPDAVVLSHCHMGINRGPSLGFAILLAQGWDPIDALDAIRGARPIAFVAYADDALHRHHASRGSTAGQLASDLRRVAKWRKANELDLEGVIRGVRIQEDRGL